MAAHVPWDASVDNFPIAVEELGALHWYEIQNSSVDVISNASITFIYILTRFCVRRKLWSISTLRKAPIPVMRHFFNQLSHLVIAGWTHVCNAHTANKKCPLRFVTSCSQLCRVSYRMRIRSLEIISPPRRGRALALGRLPEDLALPVSSTSMDPAPSLGC